MLRSVSIATVGAVLAVIPSVLWARATWRIVARPDNDLVRVLSDNGVNVERFDRSDIALTRTPPGAGLLILADEYPRQTTGLTPELYDQARQKNLRLYVEFPSSVPEMALGQPQTLKTGHWGNILERTVVASDVFGDQLKKHRILMIHDCHYVPVDANRPHLVLARVAGYDTALYGLPPQGVAPILFEHPDGGVLVATTKLSQFVTARYAPSDAWAPVWRMILQWTQPEAEIGSLCWKPSVRPSFGRDESLPVDIERRALERGADWYRKSGLLLHPSFQEIYDRPSNQGPPTADWPDGHRAAAGPTAHPPVSGDGTLGLLEGFRSKIYFDGSQSVLWWRRSDNCAESAGALTLAGSVLERPEFTQIGSNLADWLTQKSVLYNGCFTDPEHAAFGLAGWNDVPGYFAGANGYDQLWGDDNARAWLGLMRTAAALRSGHFDERLTQQFLAIARLTNRNGFVVPHVELPALAKSGWEPHFQDTSEHPSPHFQAYVQAVLLWGAHAAGDTFLQDRAVKGIRKIMGVYSHGWSATNDQFNQERARMLLPLAWLIRVDDTVEHREWLRRVATDLTEDMDQSGALLTKIKQGPQSNEAYGSSETTLIQANGDPNTDLLYTTNFALVGLHEAAAATGEAIYRDKADQIVQFLCRVQVTSDSHPQLDGGWFRGFDYRRWEYWGSDADIGWSLYSMETGWISGEILSVLALRLMKTSLWELMADSKIPQHYWDWRNRMLQH